MSLGAPSSRTRYRDYLALRQQRRLAEKTDQPAEPGADPAAGLDDDERKERQRRARTRSAWVLIRAFWGMLEHHRGPIVLALGLSTIVAVLGLVMPAGTKFAIDYVITDHPGPTGIPAWVPLADWLRSPDHREALLWVLCGGLMAITVFRAAVATAARWVMTKNTQRLKVRLRRRAFESAGRLLGGRDLPMFRLQSCEP